MYNIKNIVIYCPSKITGGHEYLSVHLAEYLLEHQNSYTIYYCDYPDGFSHTRWQSSKIKYIDLEDINKPVVVPPNTAVIVQLNLISRPERFVLNRNNSFVIYWELHSLNIKYQIFCRGLYFLTKAERRSLGKEIKTLSEMGVIKCMSYGAYSNLVKDFYQDPQDFSWLTNIAPNLNNQVTPSFSRINSDEIKFCWLGRLDKEKSRNVITYMNELEDVNKAYKLSLSIIGIGPAEDMLKQVSSKYSYPIIFLGEKRDEDLDAFIRNETEIGLASGTSAFEFSLRGKPVIMEWVIDKIYNAGIRDTYIFTEEDEKYDYSSGHALKRIGASYFRNKLSEILEDYEGISKRGYSFVMSKSAANCSNTLIKTIQDISMYSENDIFSHVDNAKEIILKGYRRILYLSKIKKILHIKKAR